MTARCWLGATDRQRSQQPLNDASPASRHLATRILGQSITIAPGRDLRNILLLSI